jgi:hypothetical protein
MAEESSPPTPPPLLAPAAAGLAADVVAPAAAVTPSPAAASGSMGTIGKTGRSRWRLPVNPSMAVPTVTFGLSQPNSGTSVDGTAGGPRVGDVSPDPLTEVTPLAPLNAVVSLNQLSTRLTVAALRSLAVAAVEERRP